MNILDQIIADKKIEVKHQKSIHSIQDLEKSAYFARRCVSLKESLKNQAGIIAECKLKSPSKGVLKNTPDNPSAIQQLITDIAQGYEVAGASAVSILTDEKYFGGKNEYLSNARSFVQIPILRKDFIIDSFQIIEAKALGADLILLIAACLEPQELRDLAKFAQSLGLEVLLEVHDANELDKSLNEYVDLVGVNNRNLKTFAVDVNTSLELAEKIPQDFVKISESGLHEAQTIQNLQLAGYRGFLIGETFMKTPQPAQTLKDLLNELQF
ncbi:MAG: indole-3-glycerol phosphate synthase TrpC [Microscillaceae bacterium]|jgi:indole-3-glycerol phosphate synthase|nr:indole-3-glycerol phosphate synthase TrpC [Microscillaceae bacterium]